VAAVLRLRRAACTSCFSSLLLLTSLPSKGLAGCLLLLLSCLAERLGVANPCCAAAWPGSAATRSVKFSCKRGTSTVRKACCDLKHAFRNAYRISSAGLQSQPAAPDNQSHALLALLAE
jgi:hypothetical protein